MENKIKAVLWDVHGVIYSGSFKSIYRALSKRLDIPEDTAGQIIEGEHLHEHLIGSFTMDNFNAILLEQFGKVADTKKLFIESMKENIIINTEVLELIDTLRLSTKQVVFSNAGDIRDLFDQEAGIYNHFDDVMLSFKLGLVKPSPEFFELACSRLKLSPEEMLLIDDNEKNVNKAKEFGMQGIMFKNIAQLKEELMVLNLLPVSSA